MKTYFADRHEAGRKLAQKLVSCGIIGNPVVLALPRGGVPVAFEVAERLSVPFDVFTVRKLRVPERDELALGAIATGGFRFVNSDIVDWLQIPSERIEQISKHEEQELRLQEKRYRQTSAPPCVEGRLVIMVDDGLATGATMLVAVNAIKCAGAASVVVAAPVAARSAVTKLRAACERVVVLFTPEPFNSVGQWYEDFAQLTDDQVQELLARRTPALHVTTGRPTKVL